MRYIITLAMRFISRLTIQDIQVFVAGGFLICAHVAIGYHLYRDCQHPERWSKQPSHDPRIYMPLVILLAVFVAVWLRRTYKWCQRMGRRNEKFNALSNYARENLRLGNLEEAAKAVRAYEALMEAEGIKPRSR